MVAKQTHASHSQLVCRQRRAAIGTTDAARDRVRAGALAMAITSFSRAGRAECAAGYGRGVGAGNRQLARCHVSPGVYLLVFDFIYLTEYEKQCRSPHSVPPSATPLPCPIPFSSPAQSGRILLIAHISQRLALYMFGYWRRPRLGTRQARSARSKHSRGEGDGRRVC